MKPSSETRRIGTDQDFIGFYARIEESLPSNTIVLDISIKSVYVFFFFFYVVAKHREEKKKISNFFPRVQISIFENGAVLRSASNK